MAKPGKLLRSVLSEERGECYSPPPNCGYSRATPRGASHPLNCSDANDSVKISEDIGRCVVLHFSGGLCGCH
jgi:hypothetical protein